MDKLSLELIWMAASHMERYARRGKIPMSDDRPLPSRIAPSELPAIATSSKNWIPAVEWITFRSLKISRKQLGKLATTCTDDRQAHVAKIDFPVVFPMYGEDAGSGQLGTPATKKPTMRLRQVL